MRILTAKQLDDWFDYYNDNPWSETRGDLRMEAFRQRLLHGIFGSEENDKDVIGPAWPYKSERDSMDWGAVIEAQDRLAKELVDDGSGTGRMKWKDE